MVIGASFVLDAFYRQVTQLCLFYDRACFQFSLLTKRILPNGKGGKGEIDIFGGFAPEYINFA